MTNKLAQITVSLMLITNWTGVQFNNKELGYVATNHVATVSYQDTTNQYTLKSVASNKATWRETQMITNISTLYYFTNLIYRGSFR